MARQNYKTVIPIWILIAVVCALIVVLIKYCSNRYAGNTVAAIEKRHISDSIKWAKQDQVYRDLIARIKVQIKLTDDSLRVANRKINNVVAENKNLINKYVGKWSDYTQYERGLDSTTTLVPNEFMYDCKDCFVQLSRTNDSIELYRSTADQMQGLLISQSKIDSQQIADLQAQKAALNMDYHDIKATALRMQPRGKLKIGIAGMFNNNFLPKGVGPSLMYEDKHDRSVAVKALFGSGPHIYVADVHVPLWK